MSNGSIRIRHLRQELTCSTATGPSSAPRPRASWPRSWCPPHPALAASGTFTQPAPIVGNHDGDDNDDGFGAGFAIPDGSGAGSSSATIEAPANALTTWVDVFVHVNHPSLDDLDLVLVSPDGKATTLASDIGGANPLDGWLYFYHENAPFSDDSVTGAVQAGTPTDHDTTPGDVDAHPGNPGASFEGLSGAIANGSWTLYAYDDTTGNVGQIDEWQLDVDYGLPASPSPSSLAVSGLPKGTTDVNLVLNDLTGAFASTEFVLESPSGRRAHVLSDSMNVGELTAVDLVLDDEAGVPIPRFNLPPPGSYRPRNYDNGDQNEWVGGGETIDMSAALSVFDGADPNGTWTLYVHQEYSDTVVTIGSWALQITTGDLPAAPAGQLADGRRTGRRRHREADRHGPRRCGGAGDRGRHDAVHRGRRRRVERHEVGPRRRVAHLRRDADQRRRQHLAGCQRHRRGGHEGAQGRQDQSQGRRQAREDLGLTEGEVLRGDGHVLAEEERSS